MHAYARTLKVLAAVAALAVVLAIAGCGGGTTGEGTGATDGGPPAGGTTVTEASLAFSPAALDVSVGDVVTFVNDDSVDHQVLIDGVTLDRQSPGESVTWTAEKAGTIDYICTLHPTMRGRIIAQ